MIKTHSLFIAVLVSFILTHQLKGDVKEPVKLFNCTFLRVGNVHVLKAPVQCSPYQAVTGKIYHLKLIPLTAYRFTKIYEEVLKNMQVSCDLIRFSQVNE